MLAYSIICNLFDKVCHAHLKLKNSGINIAFCQSDWWPYGGPVQRIQMYDYDNRHEFEYYGYRPHFEHFSGKTRARNFVMRANADGLGKALSVHNCGLYFEETKSRIIGEIDAKRRTNPCMSENF